MSLNYVGTVRESTLVCDAHHGGNLVQRGAVAPKNGQNRCLAGANCSGKDAEQEKK